MADMKQIHDFAVKWCDKFRDPKINYIDLVEHYMADDCAALGFEMDCGNAFSEKYGNAVNNHEVLERIIDEVSDTQLLGSAIFSQWRYFNHWAYSGAEILEPENRAWFIMALSRLASLTGNNPFLFQGTPQKLRIVSNNISYGPPPEPDQEVEQHLTINSEGRVWFSAYNFGERPGRYQKARTQNFKTDKDVTTKLLNAVAAYFSDEYEELFATDIGDWVLELTNTDGETYKFRGSLCADFEVGGTDLSEMIRDALKIDDLFVFDGNDKPDRVERVVVDYHRVTKVKPTPEDAEYTTRDYTEQLVLDRQSDTLEHIQNAGTGCVVSHKFYVEGGIRKILDDIDKFDLFGRIEGNPDDVIESPLETREYTIRVDFKKGPQQVIQGTYDKKALPDAWGDFANAVRRFIQYHGVGEILDYSIYSRVLRRRQDHMYCSVEFEEGYKTYYYISDDASIEVGDYVVVPAGKDNHHAVVEVVDIEYFSDDDVPLPLDKTKHIIRKCTKEDFEMANPEDDVQEVFCPVANRTISEIDCIEICDVANEMIRPAALDVFDPPIEWNDEQKRRCRCCEHHT